MSTQRHLGASRSHWLWYGCVFSMLIGCGASQHGTNVQPDAASATGREIRVEIVNRARYDEVLAGLRGNVVLVDFWATWCPPCIAGFPHTVTLSRQYADAGLKVVSVSVDDPIQQESVLSFLQSQGATFDNLISADGTSPDTFSAFDITNSAVPHYKLHDRSGNVRYTFSGYDEELDERIRELVAE